LHLAPDRQPNQHLITQFFCRLDATPDAQLTVLKTLKANDVAENMSMIQHSALTLFDALTLFGRQKGHPACKNFVSGEVLAWLSV